MTLLFTFGPCVRFSGGVTCLARYVPVKAALPDRPASPFRSRLYRKRGFWAIRYRCETQGCFRWQGLWLHYRFSCVRSSRRSFAARGRYRLHRSHRSFTAVRAFAYIKPGKPKEPFLPRLVLFVRLLSLELLDSEKLPRLFKFRPAAPVRQNPVMPDLDEAVRKNVQQEPPNELVGFQRNNRGQEQ